MKKPKLDLYIVRCDARRRCGSGAVYLRCSFKAAIKTAKDHAALKNHDSSVYPVRANARLVITPGEVRAEGYKYIPTRIYDDDGLDYL